jgi:hypothetical protein
MNTVMNTRHISKPEQFAPSCQPTWAGLVLDYTRGIENSAGQGFLCEGWDE